MVVCVLPRRRRLHATLSRPALANKGWERLVTHQPTVASAPPCVRTTTVTRCACMVCRGGTAAWRFSAGVMAVPVVTFSTTKTQKPFSRQLGMTVA